MEEPEPIQVKQDRLDKSYKGVLIAIVAVVVAAIVAIFIQIYAINTSINSEVQQIQAAQKHNRSINDAQNSVILGYLICIGTIQPQDRTAAVIQSCVAEAKKTDVTNNQ